MKFKDLGKSEFKPFKIELEIESKEELKLFIAIFNDPALGRSLRKRIREGSSIREDELKELIPNNFAYTDRDAFYQFLSKKLNQ
jgi:hypothetical protein